MQRRKPKIPEVYAQWTLSENENNVLNEERNRKKMLEIRKHLKHQHNQADGSSIVFQGVCQPATQPSDHDDSTLDAHEIFENVKTVTPHRTKGKNNSQTSGRSRKRGSSVPSSSQRGTMSRKRLRTSRSKAVTK